MRTSEGNLDRLQQGAFNFAKTFGRPVDEIVAGFKTFAQQGLNTEQILNRTQALMQAVAATTLTTSQAIEALTAASENFGQTADFNLIRVVDKWLAVERQVPVVANDFAAALKGLGQIASELGLTMDELNGVVAAVGRDTRKSGKAIANSFRTIFARITGDRAIQAFQNIGIQIAAANGGFRNLGDVLRDLNGRWEGLNQQQRVNIAQVVGQKRRYTDFLALMNNFDTFLKATNTSQQAWNDSAVASDVELKKLDNTINRVKASFQELRVSVGDELVRDFVAMVESLQGIIEVLRANSEAIADFIRGLAESAKWLGIAAAALGTLSFAGNRAIKIFSLIRTGSLAASIGVAGFAGAMRLALGTVLPLVGVIFLAVDAFQLFNAFSDDARVNAKKWGDSIREVTEETEDLADVTDETARNIRNLAAAMAVSQELKDAQQDVDNIREAMLSLGTQVGPNTFQFANVSAKEIAKATGGAVNSVEGLLKAYESAQQRVEKIIEKLREDVISTSEEKTGLTILNNPELRKVFKLQESLEGIGARIRQAKEEAELFGEPFNQVDANLKQFQDGFQQITELSTAFRTRLEEINRELEFPKEGEGFDSDRIQKLENEIVNIERAQKELNKTELDYLNILLQSLNALRSLSREQLKFQNEVNIRIIQSTMSLERQKSAVVSALTFEKQRLQNSTLTARNIQKVVDLNTQQFALERQIVEATYREKIATEEAKNNLADQAAIDKLRIQRKEELLKLTIREKALNQEIVDIARRQQQTIVTSLQGALAGNIAGLSAFFAERRSQEIDLAERREALEYELQQARKAGDQAAINDALRNLQLLEQEAQKVGTTMGAIFEAALAPIAEQRLRTLSEQLTQALLGLEAGGNGIGATLADEFKNNTVNNLITAGNEIATSIDKSGQNFSKNTSQSIDETGVDVAGEMGDAIADSSSKGSSEFNQAIVAGAKVGGQILGQALGGGGTGAATGAGIGGSLGAIGGSFLPIPGGALIGSFIGSTAGGIIGGLTDDEKDEFIEPIGDLEDSLDRNTSAIENNNRLLELNRDFINAPTRFQAPSLQGGAFGVVNGGITVNVVAGVSQSPQQVGDSVVDAINRELEKGVSSKRNTGFGR